MFDPERASDAILNLLKDFNAHFDAQGEFSTSALLRMSVAEIEAKTLFMSLRAVGERPRLLRVVR